MLLILATTLFSWPPKYIGTDDSSVPQHNEDNRSVCVKAYNKTYIHIYICNSELVKYKVTIFLLVRIEIKFWYKVLNNFYHSMFCLNAHIPLFI